jgi:ParB family chromosome partitioning protein
MTEEQKTERRITIQNNRDMESATVVRRKWIQENLLGPKPPKDAARWIGTVIASGSNDLRKAMETGHMLACELLGVAAEIKDCNRWSGKTHPLETELAGASGPRATKLTLGMVAGAAEEAIDKTAWRYATNDTKTWLSKLEEWGYPLSDVERLVITPAGPATTPEETDVESVDVVDPHQVEHHEPVDGEALDKHWATLEVNGDPTDSANETRIGGEPQVDTAPESAEEPHEDTTWSDVPEVEQQG